MQPPTYCPAHVYTLIISGLSNKTEPYQRLFTPSESVIAASAAPDNFEDNARLTFKVLLKNSLSETYDETGATIFCKSHYFI